MDRAIPVVFRRLRRELFQALLDHCAPPGCAACGGSSDRPLCPTCRVRLERRDHDPACGRCGEPLSPTTRRCSADHRWLVGIADLHAPWRYRGAGGAVVRRQKFERDPEALQCVSRALADHLLARSRQPMECGGGRRRRAGFVSI